MSTILYITARVTFSILTLILYYCSARPSKERSGQLIYIDLFCKKYGWHGYYGTKVPLCAGVAFARVTK